MDSIGMAAFCEELRGEAHILLKPPRLWGQQVEVMT